MSRSKKIFLGVSVLFFTGLAYVSYDIGSRTTFPGSKPQLKERLEKQYAPKDSVSQDTLETTKR